MLLLLQVILVLFLLVTAEGNSSHDAGASATRAPVAVSVAIDARANAPRVPFVHKWKRSFGSGHASLTLRDDWRTHMADAVVELGMTGVRYHGIFQDDNGPVVGGTLNHPTYNFTLIDSTWDHLLAHNVTPIVELSFMPAVLANCSWHGHCAQNKVNCQGYWCTQCNGHGVGPVVNPSAPPCTALEFHYQGIKQVPANSNFGYWYNLVRALVQHAVERYGLPEVRTWSFEVWNELWGMPFPQPYGALYNASARAVKSVDSQLRVGGPATATLADLPDFIQQCNNGSVPVDFVSTHHYPTDGRGGFPVCPSGEAWDPACFAQQVKAARASVPSSLPFYLTEYNVGCCLGFSQHDTPAAAAFIYRSVGDLNAHLDLYSYWTFTDVFEEGGLPRVEFKNIYGIKTISGIPKPAWRAFEMLHTHAGDTRLHSVTLSNQTAPVAGQPANDTKAVISAFATVNASSATATIAEVTDDGGESEPPAALVDAEGSLRIFLGFWGNPDGNGHAPRAVTVLLRHEASQTPKSARAYVIGDGHADPANAWVEMGAPLQLANTSQLPLLMNASQVGIRAMSIAVVNDTATSITLSMPENSAVVLAIQ